jgi:hypothetical protein
MNAARACLAAGFAFAGMQATAQPPGPSQPHPPVTVPQPSAPSSLPEGHDRDDPHARHVVEEPHGYGYGYGYAHADEARDRCTARRATGEASAGRVGTDADTIDWCAVPAFEPRYAPQIPASWWWRRHPWREWRPW